MLCTEASTCPLADLHSDSDSQPFSYIIHSIMPIHPNCSISFMLPSSYHTVINPPPHTLHLHIPPPPLLPPLPIIPRAPPSLPPPFPTHLMLPLHALRLLRRLSHQPDKKLAAPKLLRELHPRPLVRILPPQLPDLLNIARLQMVLLLVRLPHRRGQRRRRLGREVGLDL